jgi:pyruvate dehydrogenase (quinone)
MQMNGMAELITVAKYWRQWADPSLVILVLNNRDLAFVSWEQRALAGDIRFEASQELPDVPYARYAEMLGLRGIRVDRPEDVGPAWDEAFAADRPVVYEAIVDPDVPPLPPHITTQQAMAMTRAILKGDPDRGAIIRQTLRDLIEEYVPH